MQEGFGRRAWNKGRKMSHLWKEWLHPRDRRGRFIDVPDKIAKGMLSLRDGEFYDLSTLIRELNKAREASGDTRRVQSARIWRTRDENGNALWELRWTDQDGASRGKKIRVDDFIDVRQRGDTNKTYNSDRLLDEIANELEDIIPEWNDARLCACGCGSPMRGQATSRFVSGHNLRGRVPRGVVDPDYSLRERKTDNARRGNRVANRKKIDTNLDEWRGKLKDAESKINEIRSALKAGGLDKDRKAKLKTALRAAKKRRKDASDKLVELAKEQRKLERRYGRIWTGEKRERVEYLEERINELDNAISDEDLDDAQRAELLGELHDLENRLGLAEEEEWAQGMNWWERIEQQLRGFENDGTLIPKEDRADVLRQELREWRQSFSPTKTKKYKIRDDEYKIARSKFRDWAEQQLEKQRDPFDPRVQREFGAPKIPKGHRNWETRDLYNDKFVKPPPAVIREARKRQARTGRRQYIYVDPAKLSRVDTSADGDWLYEFEDEDTYIIDDALHVSNNSSEEWIRVDVNGQMVERPNLNGEGKHLLLRGFIGEDGKQYALNGMQELRERDILDRDDESLSEVLRGTDSSVYERLTYMRFNYGNPAVNEYDEEISEKYGFRIRGARDKTRRQFGDDALGGPGDGSDAADRKKREQDEKERIKREEFYERHKIWPEDADEFKSLKENRARVFIGMSGADTPPGPNNRNYSPDQVQRLGNWWNDVNRYWTDDNQKEGGRLLPTDLAADITGNNNSAYDDIDVQERPDDFAETAAKLGGATPGRYKRIKSSNLGGHYVIAQRKRDGVFEIWSRSGPGKAYKKMDEAGTISYAQDKVAMLEHKRQFDRLRREVADAVQAAGRNQDPEMARIAEKRLDNLDKMLQQKIIGDARQRQRNTDFGEGDGPDGPISPPDGGGGPRPNPGGGRGGGGAPRPGTLSDDAPRTMDSEDFEPTRIGGDAPPGGTPDTKDFIGPMPDPDEAKKENPAPRIDPDKEEILKIYESGEGDDKIEAVFFYTLEEGEIEVEGGGTRRITGLGPADFILWRRDGNDNTATELMRTRLGQNARDNEYEFERALGPVRDYADSVVEHEIGQLRRRQNGDDPDPYVDPDSPETKARIDRLAKSAAMGSEEEEDLKQEITSAIKDRNESKAETEIEDFVQSIINEPVKADVPEREVDGWEFEQNFDKEPNRFGIREGVGFWVSPDGETSYRLDWNDNKNKGTLFHVDADGNDHVVADEVGINMHDRDVQVSDIVDQDIRGVYERAPDRKRREANERVDTPEVEEDAPRQRRSPQQMAHFREVAEGRLNGNMDLSEVEGDNAPEFIGAQMNEWNSDQVDVAHFRVLTRKEDGTVVQQVITHDFVKGETKVHPVEEITPDQALEIPDTDKYAPPKDTSGAGVWRTSDVDQLEMYDPAGRHFIMKYNVVKDEDGVDLVVGEVWESTGEGPDRLRFKRTVLDKGEFDRERAQAELKDQLQDDMAIQNVKNRVALIDRDDLEAGEIRRSPHGGGDLVQMDKDGKITYLMYEGSDGNGKYLYTRAVSDGDSYKLYRVAFDDGGSRTDFLNGVFSPVEGEVLNKKPHNAKPKSPVVKLSGNVEKIDNVTPHEAVRQVIHAINGLERHKANNGKEYLHLPNGDYVFSAEVYVDEQGRPISIIGASDKLFGWKRDTYKLHDGDGMFAEIVKDPTHTGDLRRKTIWSQVIGEDPVWHDPDVEDMFKGARQERLTKAEEGLRAAKEARPSTKAKEEFKSVAKRWDPTEDGWRQITGDNYKKGDFLLQKKGANWVVTRAGERDPIAGGPKPEIAVERAREKADLDATPDDSPVATQDDDDMDMPEGWNPDVEEDVLPDVDEEDVAEEIDGYPETGEIIKDPADHPNLGHVGAWEAVRDAALHGVRPKGHADAEDFYVWYDARENVGEGRGLPVGWRSGPVAPDADGVMIIAQVPPYDRKRGAEVIGFPKFFGRKGDKSGPWFDDMPEAMIDPEGNPEIKMRRADLKSGESGRDLDSAVGEVPDGERKDWDGQVDMYRKAHDETIDNVAADTPDKPLPPRAERLNSKSPAGMFQDGRDKEWDEWDPMTSDAPKMDFPGIERYDVKYDEFTGLHHVSIVGVDGKVHKYRIPHKPSASWMQRKMDYHGLGLDEAAHKIDDIIDPKSDPDFGHAAHITNLANERGVPMPGPDGNTVYIVTLGRDRDAAIAQIESENWKWDDDAKQLVMHGDSAERFQEFGEDIFHGLADELGVDIADMPDFDGKFRIVDARIARNLIETPDGDYGIVIQSVRPSMRPVGQAGQASLDTGRIGIHFDMPAFKKQFGSLDVDPIETMSHVIMHESAHIMSLKRSRNWTKLKQSNELGGEEGLAEALAAINMNKMGKRFGFASRLSPESTETRLLKMVGGEGDAPRRSVYSLNMSVYEFWRDDLKMSPKEFYGRFVGVPFEHRRVILKDMVDPKDRDMVDKMWNAQSENWFRAVWPYSGDNFDQVNAWDTKEGKWKAPADFFGGLDRLVNEAGDDAPVRFRISSSDPGAKRRVERAKFNTTDMSARSGGVIFNESPEKVQFWEDVAPSDLPDGHFKNVIFSTDYDDQDVTAQMQDVERRMRQGGMQDPREFVRKLLSFDGLDESDRAWMNENILKDGDVTFTFRPSGETRFTMTVDVTGRTNGRPNGIHYKYTVAGERDGLNSYKLWSDNGYVSFDNRLAPTERPAGIGTRAQLARMKMFRDNNIKQFKTSTGLRIGGYGWAKMGFRMDDSSSSAWDRQNDLALDVMRFDAHAGSSRALLDSDIDEDHPAFEAFDWLNLDNPAEFEAPGYESGWVSKRFWGQHSRDTFDISAAKMTPDDRARANVLYTAWRQEIADDIEDLVSKEDVNGVANYRNAMPQELYDMIKVVSPDLMERDRSISIEEMREGIRNPFEYRGRDTLLGAGAENSLEYNVIFDWDNPVDVSRLMKWAEAKGIDTSNLV